MRNWQLLCAAGLAVMTNPALAADAQPAPAASAPVSPGSAAGIQPAITVRVDGGESAEVQAGQLVHFTGVIQMPDDAGHIANADWDFDGKGEFPKRSRLGGRFPTVIVTATHSFSEPGTYFPTLRVHTRQDGQTEETGAPAFARVRVDVRAR